MKKFIVALIALAALAGCAGVVVTPVQDTDRQPVGGSLAE